MRGAAAEGSCAGLLEDAGAFGGIGSGLLRRESKTRWACSVFRMNQPAYFLPSVDSAMWTMFYEHVSDCVVHVQSVGLTSSITKSRSLVDAIWPSSRPFSCSVSTLLTLRLACFMTISC